MNLLLGRCSWAIYKGKKRICFCWWLTIIIFKSCHYSRILCNHALRTCPLGWTWLTVQRALNQRDISFIVFMMVVESNGRLYLIHGLTCSTITTTQTCVTETQIENLQVQILVSFSCTLCMEFIAKQRHLHCCGVVRKITQLGRELHCLVQISLHLYPPGCCRPTGSFHLLNHTLTCSWNNKTVTLLSSNGK